MHYALKIMAFVHAVFFWCRYFGVWVKHAHDAHDAHGHDDHVRVLPTKVMSGNSVIIVKNATNQLMAHVI
jgi:hypothetical protein